MLCLLPLLQSLSGQGDKVMVLIPVMRHSRVSLTVSTANRRVKMLARRKWYNDWPWVRAMLSDSNTTIAEK